MTRTIALAAAATALMFAGGVAEAGESCQPVQGGVVLDSTNVAQAYRLERAGGLVPWSPLLELLPGDRLQVLASDAYVRVHSNSGADRYYRREDGLLCVVRSPETSWLSNAVRILADSLARRPSEGGRPLITRDQGLMLGLADLADGSAVVASGLRSFALPWQGGFAPFDVLVTDPRGEAVVDERALNSRRLLLREPRELSAGHYTVRVTDQNGVAAVGGFVVEASGPDSQDLASAIAKAADVLTGTRARRFDAYLDLAAYYRSTTIAPQLMAALENE